MVCLSPIVSVVIPNWNGQQHLARCLSSLQNQTYKHFEIVVVDNGSVDQSCDFVKKEFPEVRIIELSENMGFAHACNIGIEKTNGLYVVMLNNDTEARPNWLSILVQSIASKPKTVACISSRMLKMDNCELIDDAGDYLTWRGAAFKRGHGQVKSNYDQDEEVMLPCAGAALYRRSVLKQLQGFDEKYFAYLEDVDLGLRMRLCGYKCWYSPGAEVLHVGHGSNISTDLYVFLTTRNRMILFFKNIPGMLLIKKAPSLLYGWLFFFVVHRGRWAYWRGTAAFFKNIPYILEKRKEQSRRTMLTSAEIESLLTNHWPEVTLGALIKREIKRMFSQ